MKEQSSTLEKKNARSQVARATPGVECRVPVLLSLVKIYKKTSRKLSTEVEDN